MVTQPAGLQALVERWMEVRPINFPSTMTIQEKEIPEHLLDTITRHEPYRSRVLADGRLWLGIPLLAGIGLEYELVEPVVEPFGQWSESISGLKIRLTWARDMTGQEIDYRFETIHRVAYEDNQWRLLSLWDDATRADMTKTRQLWTDLTLDKENR